MPLLPQAKAPKVILLVNPTRENHGAWAKRMAYLICLPPFLTRSLHILKQDW